MRLFFLIVFTAVLLLSVFSFDIGAVPVGRVLEWKTGVSTVVFDGRIHAEKGLRCNECHPKLFMMKKGHAQMKMIQIIGGKFCGECHNGKRAFASNDPESCARCHKNL